MVTIRLAKETRDMRWMHRILPGGLLLTCLLWGCSSDEGGDGWSSRLLWPLGTRPLASPTSQAVLFTQEQPPAGLYLLLQGTAAHLNPTGPAARSDYAWSSDGARFCFSGPGESGSTDAGIFVAAAAAPTEFERLWDSGSHPRFLADGQGVVCAGPEDGGETEGIWHIALSNHERDRLAERGVSPEVSPDGLKIAYLMTGGNLGRILVILNLETSGRDTLVGEVLNYSWLGDSRTLVFETFRDGLQRIYLMGIADSSAVAVAFGTLPAGFPQGTEFVYTGLEADRIAGLWVAAPNRAAERISPIGTWATPASTNRIVAQDSAGIIELTR
jgi:hypothetical protein